jgi:hypothetical protein
MGLVACASDEKQVDDEDGDEKQGSDDDMERLEAKDAFFAMQIGGRDVVFVVVVSVIGFGHAYKVVLNAQYGQGKERFWGDGDC